MTEVTEQEKAATAAALAEKAKADTEFEATLEGLTEEEKIAKRAEKEVQIKVNLEKKEYEAKLQREREAREKAEKALADRRFKDAEAERKRKEAEEAGLDNEGKPLTARELRDILAEERKETQITIQAERISSIAKELTGSAAEADLVVEIHKNRTFPAHLTLREQLEEAVVIANKDRLIGERNEAFRALRGREGVNRDAAGTHYAAPVKVGKPQMTPLDRKAIEQVGFVLNSKTGQYEKKLKNGKILVRDATGKVHLL